MPAMDAADDDVEVEEVLLELTPVTSKRSRARAVKSAAARSAGDGGDDDSADASSGAGVTTAAAPPPAPPARASAVTPAAETYIELLRQAEETEATLRRAQAAGSSVASLYAGLLDHRHCGWRARGGGIWPVAFMLRRARRSHHRLHPSSPSSRPRAQTRSLFIA